VGVGLEAMMRAMEHPCRIEAVLYAHPSSDGPTWMRSYLTSLRLPVSHIEYCFGRYFDKLPTVPAPRADDYDTCLHWQDGFPEGAQELIGLLSEALVLPTRDDRIELAMALDWYKILDPNVASTEWENTEVGQLVSKAKYWKSSPSTRRSAAHQLIDTLSKAIDRHPALSVAPNLVSVPGSAGDGVSIGEYIAAGVAEQTEKVLIKTRGPARDPRKAGGAPGGLDGIFQLPSSVDGACVVVDDVYKSGVTMRATAFAARQAGATAVYCLAAAKTISG
jgi:hypothetical protein